MITFKSEKNPLPFMPNRLEPRSESQILKDVVDALLLIVVRFMDSQYSPENIAI